MKKIKEENTKECFLGIEIEEGGLFKMKPKTMQHFWKGIRTGKFNPPSDEEIMRMTNEIYFNGNPMTQLSDEEETKLRSYVFGKLKSNLIRPVFQQITEKPLIYCFLPSGSKITFDGQNPVSYNGHFFFYVDEKVADRKAHLKKLADIGATDLTPQEKLELFSDINIWAQARYFQVLPRIKIIGSLRDGDGSRSIRDYDLENVKKIIGRIRKRTGKTDLKVLDVGGMLGQACYDLQEMDPNVITTNLTLTEDPTNFPVETVLASAERMPSEFRGRYDLVLSNMAFRYFMFPHKALENCLDALSVGGEAHLSLDGVFGTQEKLVETLKRMELMRQDRRVKFSLTDLLLREKFTAVPENYTWKPMYVKLTRLKK